MFDAIVIGAGPAGATLALLLARAGWQVAVVEKKAFPRRKVCGEFISATSLPLIHELGIRDFYSANAGPEVKRVGLFAADTVLTATMPATGYALGQWGRALGREHLDTVLLEEAKRAGATVLQPWCLSSLVDHQTHITCTGTSEGQSTEITARMVFMANGSWERDIIHPSSKQHRPSDLLAFKAHFLHCLLEPDLMPLLSFPGGYGGLVHSDHDRVSLSCCIRRDMLQTIRKKNPGLQAGEAVFNHILSTSKEAKAVFSEAQRDGAWLSAGPLRPGIRSCYADGLFYVGNSAGEAHPIIAEGISIAMQSSWLLSQILLAEKKETLTRQRLDVIGQAYSKKWHAQFANRIRAAALFAQVATRPHLVKLLLPIFKRFPSLLTYGAALSGKIKDVIAPSIG